MAEADGGGVTAGGGVVGMTGGARCMFIALAEPPVGELPMVAEAMAAGVSGKPHKGL
jgi:hypothetical protein